MHVHKICLALEMRSLIDKVSRKRGSGEESTVTQAGFMDLIPGLKRVDQDTLRLYYVQPSPMCTIRLCGFSA
jgi:hypothetical protein